MRIESNRLLRIVVFVLATLGATGALVAAGLNETVGACDPACGVDTPR